MSEFRNSQIFIFGDLRVLRFGIKIFLVGNLHSLNIPIKYCTHTHGLCAYDSQGLITSLVSLLVMGSLVFSQLTPIRGFCGPVIFADCTPTAKTTKIRWPQKKKRYTVCTMLCCINVLIDYLHPNFGINKHADTLEIHFE